MRVLGVAPLKATSPIDVRVLGSVTEVSGWAWNAYPGIDVTELGIVIDVKL
jgi:hypothetical protein